jgi:dual specificity tyrosine-phosphorylation-regulated kinase 2/3/4
VNSKGRRRRPGTKTLAHVLRSEDEMFVDFIAKCLTWDPEKRIKPQQALRHPFILPQRRPKVLSPVLGSKSMLSSTSSLSSSSRSKPTETPKKSQIGAPAPLTSRISRTNSGTVTATPLTSASTHTLGSSSRSYRASQSQTFSTYHASASRTMSSFAVSSP